jgi:hypothetical protein
MKALLIIAALAGMSFTSYGQHTKKCAKHTKTVAKTHTSTACRNCGKKGSKMSSSSLAGNSREAIWDKLLTCSRNKRAVASNKEPNFAPVVTQPCFSYRKNNIVVTECPGMTMKPGDLDFMMQGTYGGYYPHAATIATVNPMIAPQPNVLSPYRGTAPQDGNFCGPDCVSR